MTSHEQDEIRRLTAENSFLRDSLAKVTTLYERLLRALVALTAEFEAFG